MVNIHSITPTGYGEAEKSAGYKHNPNCLICAAKNRQGEPIRDSIDEFMIGHNNTEIRTKLMEYGIVADSDYKIKNHIIKHAPYILTARQNGSKKVQKMIVRIHQEKQDVGEALQRIIDIGDTLVAEGAMPVTEKLYIEALKEQGRRGIKTSLDAEFETLDGDFINKVKALNNGQPA